MDGMIYVATSSSANVLQAQAINANNLANANTPGFKADHPQFVSAYNQAVGTLPSRIYSSINGTRTDFTSGELIPTGRNFDIAINGDGWLAVSSLDGSEAYIRTNSMQITEEGLLVTANQLPLLGTGGPITLPPGQKIEIGTDGTISAMPLDGSSNTAAIIDRLKLVKPDVNDLVKSTDGLVRTKGSKPLEADSTVKIASGYLEASNVNVIESMITMITLSRQFEMQLKMLNIAKENSQSTDRTIALS